MSLYEWIGVRKPVLRSFWPIRIVPLGLAQTTYTRHVSTTNEKRVSVRVETLKRTDGPISSLTAFVEGLEDLRLDLKGNYHQPPMGVDEQELVFEALPDGDYVGKTLVIVAECRMRKGRWAIRKKVHIES